MAEEEEDYPVVVDVEALKALLGSMETELENLSYESKIPELCSIYRVPPSVGNVNRSDYEPKLISIGPYHHGAEGLEAMEPLKWSYLEDLIARSEENNNSLEKFITAIFPREPVIRAYYSEEIDLTPDALVKMMVVDGCFIVELLIKWFLNEEDDRIGAVKWNLPLLQNDLLLLENQIPFFVLAEIFQAAIKPSPVIRTNPTLLELAATYVAPDQLRSLLKPRPSPFPNHLLHLYHEAFKPTPGYDKPAADNSWSAYILFILIWPFKMLWRIVSFLVLGLLSLTLSCRLHSKPLPGDDEKEKQQKAPRTTGSATELDEAGVKFCKKNKSGSFLEVTFSGGRGTMEMPKLPIHEATPTRFRNLLAFEQCYPAAGNYFTSYAVLMNNLIDTPGDVAVLKAAGIIESKLGRDEEVADLFNQLCKGSFLKYDDHYLVDVFKDVRQYSLQDCHRWRAKLVHDYFASPWAVVSLVAAAVLLALTVLQTAYTIYPYYHPRG